MPDVFCAIRGRSERNTLHLIISLSYPLSYPFQSHYNLDSYKTKFVLEKFKVQHIQKVLYFLLNREHLQGVHL